MRAHTRASRPLGLKPNAKLSKASLNMAKKVERYDLAFVTNKLVEDRKLNKRNAESAAVEFKKFMVLAGLGIKPLAIIGPVLDELWHQFILFTSPYRKFCEDAVGTFIDHQPCSRSAPVPRLALAGQNFFLSYEKFFGSLPGVWFEGMDKQTRGYFKTLHKTTLKHAI